MRLAQSLRKKKQQQQQPAAVGSISTTSVDYIPRPFMLESLDEVPPGSQSPEETKNTQVQAQVPVRVSQPASEEWSMVDVGSRPGPRAGVSRTGKSMRDESRVPVERPRSPENTVVPRYLNIYPLNPYDSTLLAQ